LFIEHDFNHLGIAILKNSPKFAVNPVKFLATHMK